MLGFLGVTAVLGLIFGIVGIITTSGVRRRGMGLAIAAIPISLVSGALSILLLWAVFFGMRAMEIPLKLQAALGEAPSIAESANTLREIGSAAFNEEVSTEALQAWITQINTKHGKLISTSTDTQQMLSETPDGAKCLNVSGKFVNGPASIRLFIKEEQPWSMRIDDIDLGGSSPRGSAAAPPTAKNEPTTATP